MSAWLDDKAISTNSDNNLEFEDNFEVKTAEKLEDSTEYLLKLGKIILNYNLHFCGLNAHFLR